MYNYISDDNKYHLLCILIVVGEGDRCDLDGGSIDAEDNGRCTTQVS